MTGRDDSGRCEPARPRATHVHRDEQRLVATCTDCGLALETVDGFDPDVALGTLFQLHPQEPEALHRPAVPGGWRAAG